jgi:elongation factor G
VTGDTLCDREAPIVLERMEFPETVIACAIAPSSTGDRDRLGEALARLQREDPTFRAQLDQQTGQLVIAGMGELHLDILCTRIARDFNIPIDMGKPEVAYKQSLRSMKEIEGRLVKQTGGSGQYAVVRMRIAPSAERAGLEFRSSIVGGAVPRQYIPAVAKGIEETMSTGGRLRFPFVGVEAELYDGQSHDVDSSDLAFRKAAQIAFSLAAEGNIVLLEPIMKLEVQTPEEYIGDVIGDLGTRRAEISDIAVLGAMRNIHGRVPVAEMFQYVSTLRGMTQGRASYSMEPAGYAPVPDAIAQAVIEERLAARGAAR